MDRREASVVGRCPGGVSVPGTVRDSRDSLDYVEVSHELGPSRVRALRPLEVPLLERHLCMES